MNIKTSLIFYINLFGFFLSFQQAFAIQYESYKCTLNVDSPWRARYDQNIEVDVNLPVTNDPLKNSIIIESEVVNDSLSKKILFLGNVSIDPTSGRKKLLIGAYHMWHVQRGYEDGFLSLPITIPDHPEYQYTYYAHPIISAASDSGYVETFTHDFDRHKIKFACKSNNPDLIGEPTVFNPQNQVEVLKCNVRIRYQNTRNTVEEFNKDIAFGYRDTKRDLQPIFDDQLFDQAFFRNFKVMGNLHYNSETRKTELLIGLYARSVRHDPDDVLGYWMPPNQRLMPNGHYPVVYIPILEASTQSNFLELRSHYRYLYQTYIGCKLVDSRLPLTDR